MSDKLQIPGPDEHDDFSEIDTTIVLGWAVCMLICIALFLFFRQRRPEPEPPAPDDPIEARQLELMDRPSARAEKFQNIEFGDKDAVAVFRHGPRKAAEAACRDLAEPLDAGTLTHTVHLELLKTIDRRAEHAPWTCLLEGFFAKRISADLDLFGELGEFWAEMQRFEASPAITSSVLDDFRRTRRRPEHPDFYSWLRLCAIHPKYEASDACQKIAYQLSPAQGRDVLAMVEKHLGERDPKALRADMKVIVPGVGRLARTGQPEDWTVEKTRTIDAYDTSLRLGATFLLCRLVHSPHEDVASQAALQLAEVATVAARATDENLLTRWRESCAIGFHREAPDERGVDEVAPQKAEPQKAEPQKAAPQPDRAEVLAVWNGEEGESPDYTLAWAVERGDCPAYDDRPSWYCGVERWQGKGQALDLEMMGFFTETRYVEWASE